MSEARKRAQAMVKQLTVGEKIGLLSTSQQPVPRLGLKEFHIGGEAAHGIVDRQTHHTTSFPIPLTLAQTWEPQLAKEIGTAVATEARALYNTTGQQGWLMPWAPTIDLERDPRWGRNEEGYGEDPLLTGQVAGGYIDGLQGDPAHLRVAAAPKHFFANNTEAKRGSESNSVMPRMKHEYYLKVFKFAYRDHAAQSMMTGYNGVNGIPMMQSPELSKTVKGHWGMDGTIVTDGAALTLNVEDYQYYHDYPHAIADALKKGIDCFVDDLAKVTMGVKQALARQLIDEADIDRAVENTLTVRARLGQLDGDTSEAELGQAAIGTAQHDALVQREYAAGTVLLKNEHHTLPLTATDRVLLTGPAADRFVRDWYAALPMNRETLRQGLAKALGERLTYVNSNDRATLTLAPNARNAADKTVADRQYEVERWQNDLVFLRDVDTGRYLRLDEDGHLGLHGKEVYDWVVREAFVLEADGQLYAVDHNFRASDQNAMEAGGRGALIGHVTLVETGIARVLAKAQDCTKILIAAGNHPLIAARETEDRQDLTLPAAQQALFDAVAKLNKPVIGLLLTGYPYLVDDLKATSLLEVGYAGQSLGRALAKVLTGVVAPTGKLAQTWYNAKWPLPSMRDYDIEKTHRTYQYVPAAQVAYPFGYGLTYGRLKLENATTTRQGDQLTIQVTLSNPGRTPVTDTVQVYLRACRLADHPDRQQLITFAKTTVAPGAQASVTLQAALADFGWYDAKRQTSSLPQGTYTLGIGFSSGQFDQVLPLAGVAGTAPTPFDLAQGLPARAFDDYQGATLDTVAGQYEAVRLSKNGQLTYCHIATKARHIQLSLLAEQAGSLTLQVNNEQPLTVPFAASPDEQQVSVAVAPFTDGTIQLTATVPVVLLDLIAD
ncbi:beta-glucosidase [Lacticaseibacillus jixianensis]|uniref:Beta-glucosidase n=1 Tax=Lacticaseibacillus jixianensis TaxID=2486012 RepID=A0ABW4B8E5_9LACO|nr:glycoside hydrolase family 3 protein [Lacticaseibacillus jixianensis]